MKKHLIALGLLTVMLFGSVTASEACTSLIVTKGASTDGSVMITYAMDTHTMYGELYFHPAANHAPGTMRKIFDIDNGKYHGSIPEVAHTYGTIGNMNEFQLAISETTFTGREELQDTTGTIDYGSLIYTTLTRAKTAREAIQVMADLANTYGYCSTGESFSIADKNEAWIMEIIGKGTKMVKGKNVNKGIVWVARMVPDGYISGHANQSRITTFPLKDPNTLYSKDVISFAREMGYFNGKDADFNFAEAYNPISFMGQRTSEARVWSFLREYDKGMDAYTDHVMGKPNTERMPLWVKPDRKISVKNVADAMRNHFEGTPMDMRYDVGAGGSELPYRWRPLTFTVDGKEYINERAVATQQTGFWFVSQSRSYVPDYIGGIFWFAADDAGTSALLPNYTSTKAISDNWKEGNGDMITYSPTSAFWIFNRLAQFAYLRYNVIGKRIQEEANKWENEAIESIKKTDKMAAELYKESPEKCSAYLTDFTVQMGNDLFNKWVALDQYLLVKYIDGNIKQEKDGKFLYNGNEDPTAMFPQQPGYTPEFYKRIAEDHGKTLEMIK